MIYDILPVNNYIGNGQSKTFQFNFYIDNTSQLKVNLFKANGIKYELVYNLDYSINEVQNPQGGYITFPLEGSSYNVLAENEKLSIELTLPIAQTTQYTNSSLLNLSSLEYSLDYLTRLVQILARKITKCLKVEECTDISLDELIDNINSNSALASQYATQSQNALQSCNQLKSDVANLKNQVDELVLEFNEDNILETLDTNKANTSLSNLNTTGKAVIDGTWVSTQQVVFDSAQVGTYTVDLAPYLPEDDYNYEVLLSMAMSSTSSATTTLNVNSSLITSTYIGISTSNSNYGKSNAMTFILPIGSDKKLFAKLIDANPHHSFIVLNGYRRLGTNA